MKLTVAILMIAVGLATSSIAAAGENADVQGFIRYADTCQHVAGEWDSELAESDRTRIQRSVMKYCGGAQAQSKALKKKYKNSPEVLRTIAAHENDSVTSYVREAGITAPSLVGHYSNQVWSDGEDPHAVSGYYVCNDPAVPAQLKPLTQMPQRAFSYPVPDADAGCCRTRSSRR